MSIMFSATRRTRRHLARFLLDGDNVEAQTERQLRIADRLDEGHCSEASRDASPAGHESCVPYKPRHADRQRGFVPCCGAQLRSSSKYVPETSHELARRFRTTWCAARYAWLPVRVIGGQSVGDLLGALPTQSRCGDVAVGRPRCCAHVPAVGGVPITGGLQMFGNQRSILISRCQVT